MNSFEKYKIKAFQNSDRKWEVRCVSPVRARVVDPNVVETGQSSKIGGVFDTKDDADKYALEYLKSKLKISGDEIVIF